MNILAIILLFFIVIFFVADDTPAHLKHPDYLDEEEAPAHFKN